MTLHQMYGAAYVGNFVCGSGHHFIYRNVQLIRDAVTYCCAVKMKCNHADAITNSTMASLHQQLVGDMYTREGQCGYSMRHAEQLCTPPMQHGSQT